MNSCTETKLIGTIMGIDCMAQSRLDEIADMARLASYWLSGDARSKPAIDIVNFVNSIAEKAEDLQNEINAAAESVDCNYIVGRDCNVISHIDEVTNNGE